MSLFNKIKSQFSKEEERVAPRETQHTVNVLKAVEATEVAEERMTEALAKIAEALENLDYRIDDLRKLADDPDKVRRYRGNSYGLSLFLREAIDALVEAKIDEALLRNGVSK